MRKFIPIILITIFFFDICGYQLLFNKIQHNIQREIKQKIRKELRDEDISIIVVPVNDESEINWINPQKEFSYKGEMYNVVNIKIENQKKYYYCIWDVKEKQLIANYNKTNNNKQNKERIKRISNILLFFQVILITNIINSSYFHYFDNPLRLITNYLIIPSPPPKIINF
jgi:hypothetical protein